ncbi:hypothetical protein [Marinobacter sp. 1_MG-2023]|uniref:hypothetical protein n=1 Tax=Marinobacter sp. 1_MG-2023 TaxID=3062627 RepID=UPI0026E2A2E2|nr:hypothetical protein [Marinobacter sp. 1_MG-2023]MDO6822477.1 hypothetical protein [Marinobacter sp. 1_MG-2023]
MVSLPRCAVTGLVVVLGAAGMSAAAEGIFSELPLSDDELSTQRGGFSLNNLEISIGLEQVVSVNGETLAINRLTIPNLNQLISGNAMPHKVETVLGIINSGQNGQALVSATSNDGGWMTLIQNDLNSSVIQNARQLNIELNNLGAGYRMPDNLRAPILQFLGH